MAYLIGVPLLALLAMIQSAILSHLRFLDGRPDLVLLAVVGWTLTGRAHEAMIWGLIGGLFLDLFSGLPFGATAIALVIISYLVSLTEGRFWEAHLLMPLGAMLGASLLFYLFSLVTLFLSGQSVPVVTVLSRVILPGTFLNVLLAIPAAQLAGGLRQSLFPPEVKI